MKKITVPATKRAKAIEFKGLVKAYNHCRRLSCFGSDNLYIMRMLLADEYSDLLIPSKLGTTWYFKYQVTDNPNEDLVAFVGMAKPLKTFEAFKRAVAMFAIFCSLESKVVEDCKGLVIDMIMNFFESCGVAEWATVNGHEEFVATEDHRVCL